MMLRALAVSLIGLTPAGCVNNDTLSGDVYSASEAKQVQNVTYGTIVNVRPVQIQGGDDNNVIGAIGGAVLGGFLGNTVGGGTGVLWQQQQVRLPAARPVGSGCNE